MSKMFLNKEFCTDGIGLRVEARITFFNKHTSSYTSIRTLRGICVGSETGFHLADIRLRAASRFSH